MKHSSVCRKCSRGRFTCRRHDTVPDRSAWFQFVRAEQAARERDIDAMAEREAGRSPLDASGGSFVNPLRLCRAIDAALPDRSVIVADGGDFVGTASYTVRPRQPLAWLDPGVFVSQQQPRAVRGEKGCSGTAATVAEETAAHRDRSLFALLFASARSCSSASSSL